MIDGRMSILEGSILARQQHTIGREGNGAGASYIQSAELNGKTWNKCWLFRDELFKGGVLKLKMGTQPNNNWGLEAPVHCPQ